MFEKSVLLEVDRRNPGTSILMVRLDNVVFDRLVQLALRLGQPLSTVVQEAVESYLEQKGGGGGELSNMRD